MQLPKENSESHSRFTPPSVTKSWWFCFQNLSGTCFILCVPFLPQVRTSSFASSASHLTLLQSTHKAAANLILLKWNSDFMPPNLPHYLLVKTETPEHIPEGSYDLAPASSLPVPQPQGPATLPQRHHALRPSSLCTHWSLGLDYPDNLLLPGTINSFRKPSLSLHLSVHIPISPWPGLGVPTVS